MSKISLIHDALIALVTSKLSGYTKLPNPYFVLDNPETFLRKGFGVAVGSGFRTDRLISCQFSWQRNFTISLTNQVTTTDNNNAQKETIVKNLLEAHYAVLKGLEEQTTLTFPYANSPQLCIQAKVQADSGLKFLEGKVGRYYLIEIDVVTEYLENYTS